MDLRLVEVQWDILLTNKYLHDYFLIPLIFMVKKHHSHLQTRQFRQEYKVNRQLRNILKPVSACGAHRLPTHMHLMKQTMDCAQNRIKKILVK